MYVNKLEPKNQTIYMTSKIGISRPLYSSAMGKAILSTFTQEEMENYFNAVSLTAFTKHTITNRFQLEEEIENIKKRSVAFDDEEMEQECYCIGASIVENEKVRAAFSVSMPKYRLTEKNKQAIIAAVLATKKQIESAVKRL